MWFLTIDPSVGIPFFIAQLSERQYCWRVLEDFHCEEYIQFFDIHRGSFKRLHFSFARYNCCRTTKFRQIIYFSITSTLSTWTYALTQRSRQQILGSSNFNVNANKSIFWRCSCHSVSSWDRSSNFGALGLRSWSSLGQFIRAKDFGLEFYCGAQQPSCTLHVGLVFCMSVLFRRIDFGGVMSWNT